MTEVKEKSTAALEIKTLPHDFEIHSKELLNNRVFKSEELKELQITKILNISNNSGKISEDNIQDLKSMFYDQDNSKSQSKKYNKTKNRGEIESDEDVNENDLISKPKRLKNDTRFNESLNKTERKVNDTTKYKNTESTLNIKVNSDNLIQN